MQRKCHLLARYWDGATVHSQNQGITAGHTLLIYETPPALTCQRPMPPRGGLIGRL
jgi:hypothetical protein